MGLFGGRLGSFAWLPFLVILFCPQLLAGTTTRAEFQKKIQALDTEIKTIAADLNLKSIEATREKYQPSLERLMQQCEDDLVPSFAPLLSSFVSEFKSPSLDYLKQSKEAVQKDLKTLLATADETRSPLKDDGLQMNATPYLGHLRASLAQQVMMGQPQLALQLLEFLAHNLTITPRYLQLLHLDRVLNGKMSVRWDAYVTLDQRFKMALLQTRLHFPNLPDFSYGQLNSRQKWEAAINQFAADFVDGRGNLEKPDQEWFARSVKMIQAAQVEMDSYRQHFFPKPAADEQLTQFMSSLADMPGADQCYQLANGISAARYDGNTCRPAEFFTRLNRFLRYYEKVAEPSLILQLMGHATDYRDRVAVDGPESRGKAWIQFKEKVKAIPATALTDSLQQPWEKAREELTQGTSGEALRDLLDSEASGMAIWKHLKRVLIQHGIGLRPGMNEWVVAGTVRDFTADVQATEMLRSSFVTNVVEPLKKYRLNEDPAVEKRYQEKLEDLKKIEPAPSEMMTQELRNGALLETLESRLVTFDSGSQWCSLFNDPSKSEEAKMKASPWVVKLRSSTDNSPSTINSSNGIQRLKYFGVAKIANAYSIQNSDRPEKTFAALAVRTAVATILPNVVQVRMLLQDSQGKYTPQGVSSLGITTNEKGVMSILDNRYQFPAYENIIQDSYQAWQKMLFRFAMRKTDFLKLTPTEQASLSEAEREARYHQQFETQYFYILNAFIDQYRAEMLSAAKLAQKWDEQIKGLKYEVPTDAPDFLGELGMSKFEKDARLPGQRGKQTNVAQNLHEWIIFLKRTHYLSQLPKYKNADAKTLQNAATAMKVEPPGELKFPEFFAQFKIHGQFLLGGGGAIYAALVGLPGGDEGIPPRTLESMFQVVMNTRVQRLEILEYARSLVLFRFPALRLGDAYKTYQGSRTEYQNVMTAYSQNAVKEANKFQALGAMTWWDHTKGFWVATDDEAVQSRKIIDEVITNLPLLDVLLKNFPDQMAFVCSEQSRRQISERNFDIFLASVNGVGGTCALIGLIPGAQAVGLIGLGVSAVSAGAQTYRAYLKIKQVDGARNFSVAAGAQLGIEADDRNWDYVREMQKEADHAYYLAAFEVGVASVAAITTAVAYMKAARLATLAEGNKVTALQMVGRDFSLAGQFGRNAVSGSANAVKQKLTQWKFLTDEVTPLRWRIYNTVNNTFRGPHYMTGELAYLERASHSVAFAFDEFNNVFWRVLGTRWANTARAFYVQVAIDSAVVIAPTAWYFGTMAAENETATLMSFAYEHPEENAELLEANEGGWISHAEILAALKATARFWNDYLKKANEHDQLLKSLSAEENSDKAAFAEAKKNLRSVRDEFESKLAKMTPHTGEYFAAQKNLRLIDLTLKRWEN